MHEVYAALVLPQTAVNLHLAPSLDAIDLYPDCRLSESYEVSWRQLAAVLGTRPPWFHPALRDQETISNWNPGDPPAIVPANHVELPTRALAELAADEPDGSPAAAVCLWLARHLRRRDTEEAQQSIDEIRAAAADPDNDCAYVHIAATPALLLRPEDDELDEVVRRAGWAQIVERRDVLAAAAAEAVLRWDGGKAWPVGETARFDPASCPAAAEWTARLRPAPAGQPPTVLERQLLANVSSADRGELLYDDASGCPAVRRTDHLGTITVYACVPQRISTVAPLSEVTLSGGYGVDPHQRRRPLARALPARPRPVLGIQRRRANRPRHAPGPAPRRHHRLAHRPLRHPAARPGIPYRGHPSGRDHHLQPRSAPRRPRGLTRSVAPAGGSAARKARTSVSSATDAVICS
jgi:hypothetical protein